MGFTASSLDGNMKLSGRVSAKFSICNFRIICCDTPFNCRIVGRQETRENFMLKAYCLKSVKKKSRDLMILSAENKPIDTRCVVKS